MQGTYTGFDTRDYPDYMNAVTGHMLTASPGETCDVAVAPGRAEGLPELPGDGRWIPAAKTSAAPVKAAAPKTAPAPSSTPSPASEGK